MMMTRKRWCFAIFGLWMVLQGFPGHVRGAQLVDRIVAVVNDDIITLSELQKALTPYETQIKSRSYAAGKERKLLFSVREQVLNQLIDEKLTGQEIERTKIIVDDSEIDGMIERVKEAKYLTDEELRGALKQQGLSMSDYRSRLKDQILRSKLVNREIKSKIVITQEDIKKHYESQLDQYAGEKQYHLRHIIMAVPRLASATEKSKILKKMEGVLEKLKGGGAFAALAREYSQSPLAKDGGNLGTFKQTSLSPQIQAAIRDLKKGGYTPVIDTDRGYQIFFVEDILHEKGKTLDEVSGEIRQALYKKIVDRQFKNWLKGLRKKSHVKVIK